MNHPRTASRAVLGLILLLYLVLAVAYSASVPVFEAPDENAHFDHARFIRTEQRLPEQGQAGEAHQPPLYYLLAATASLPGSLEQLAQIQRENPAWVWAGVGQDINVIYHTAAEVFPWRGAVLAVHLMRALSVLLGLATVVVVYLIGREFCPRNPVIPLGAAAIAAFVPQFIFISGVVNNDNLAVLCAAIATWMMVRLLVGHGDRWTLLGLGLSLGAGLMAKQSVLVLLPLAGLVLIYVAIRDRSVRWFLESLIIVGGAIVVISGWWYYRNLVIYGDLFGLDPFLAYRPQEISATITSWNSLRVFLDKMHRSFWGLFGWMNLPMPRWIYRLLVVWYAILAIGLGAALLKRRRDLERRWAVWVLLSCLPLLFLLWVVAYGHQFGGSGWQGRYLFPALPAISLLAAAGLTSLFSGRKMAAPVILTALGLLVVAAWALSGLISPAYETVTRPQAELDNAQRSMNVNFGDVIQLSGYDLHVTSEGAEPGVALTLYWQGMGVPAEDYKVFVHLVDPNWELHGQGDDYPLGGRFPTSEWLPGDLVIDPHPITIPQPLPPGQYKVAMGWYLESTGERLPVLEAGREVGNLAETISFELPP